MGFGTLSARISSGELVLLGVIWCLLLLVCVLQILIKAVLEVCIAVIFLAVFAFQILLTSITFLHIIDMDNTGKGDMMRWVSICIHLSGNFALFVLLFAIETVHAITRAIANNA